MLDDGGLLLILHEVIVIVVKLRILLIKGHELVVGKVGFNGLMMMGVRLMHLVEHAGQSVNPPVAHHA